MEIVFNQMLKSILKIDNDNSFTKISDSAIRAEYLTIP